MPPIGRGEINTICTWGRIKPDFLFYFPDVLSVWKALSEDLRRGTFTPLERPGHLGLARCCILSPKFSVLHSEAPTLPTSPNPALPHLSGVSASLPTGRCDHPFDWPPCSSCLILNIFLRKTTHCVYVVFISRNLYFGFLYSMLLIFWSLFI